MEHIVIEIPRRVPVLDVFIVLVVAAVVATDLLLIRDPLHGVLALLLVPAALRVSNGFYTFRMWCSGTAAVVETRWFWATDKYELSYSDVITTKVRAFPFLGSWLQVFENGVWVCNIGRTCTMDELQIIAEHLESHCADEFDQLA